jgi:hypothetical protein
VEALGVKRRDAALLRALGTPHKKQSELKIGKPKPKSGADANPSVPPKPIT